MVEEPDTLYLTAVNLAELLAGIEQLPRGRRRKALNEAFTGAVLPLFDGRILPFDAAAAAAFASIHARATAAGRPIGFADAAIAAIALSRGFTLATRNGRDFSATGIALLDPWQDREARAAAGAALPRVP